ncbi:hypothetical protein E2C01_001655 [Portunus trituberculatus]|uniref:Uncharacterized protein n=1 Tax=Portunus trituberculatus TaxID=210409 RepID=A0A5B7CH78_PORTR|nr:hypothetical protein [Portunus trituberculatus]
MGPLRQASSSSLSDTHSCGQRCRAGAALIPSLFPLPDHQRTEHVGAARRHSHGHCQYLQSLRQWKGGGRCGREGGRKGGKVQREGGWEGRQRRGSCLRGGRGSDEGRNARREVVIPMKRFSFIDLISGIDFASRKHPHQQPCRLRVKATSPLRALYTIAFIHSTSLPHLPNKSGRLAGKASDHPRFPFRRNALSRRHRQASFLNAAARARRGYPMARAGRIERA